MRPIPLFWIHDPVSSLSHLAAAVATLYAGWRLVLKARGNGFRVGAALLASFWGAALTSLLVLDGRYGRMPYGGVVTAYMAVAGIFTVSLYRLHRRFGPRTLAALTAGCLCYAAGAAIDAADAPVLINGIFGPHEIFHLLVVAGAACHYAFIYGWADLRLRKARAFLGSWAPRSALGASVEA